MSKEKRSNAMNNARMTSMAAFALAAKAVSDININQQQLPGPFSQSEY
jgi:hypothetical protein